MAVPTGKYCGCLTAAFISKAHTNFTSILMEAQSQEEFVKRQEALPKRARDALWVCTCKGCKGPEQLQYQGEPYKTRLKLNPRVVPTHATACV